MEYWITLADGTKTNKGINTIDRKLISQFQVGAFITNEAPLAYRRRTKLAMGGAAEVCHIVVLPSRICFVFENGELVERKDWDENSKWYYSIT